MTRVSGPKLDDALRTAVDEATDRLVTWLDARFTEEITTAKWPFPTPPQVRDIVNTGALLRSQQVTRTSSGEIRAEWPVAYAAQAHEGGVGLDGRRFPARRWTQAPLAKAQETFNGFLAEAVNRRTR